MLNRRTGEPLFPVEERSVPQTGAVPGEYLSPTQPFPVKPEPLDQLGISPDDAWGLTFWEEGRCREQLESLTTGPIYTPPSLTGTVVFPSPLGGNNWGAPAVDPERQIMVANTKHLPVVILLAERPPRACLATGWLAVLRDARAAGLAAGLWRDKLPTTANAVPMSYTSGGRQFVLIAAGGHWTSEAPAGDHLIAYALED